MTLHELVEAITGQVQPRDPASAWAVPLDGHIPVPELKHRLELGTMPEEKRGRYHTPSWCCSC